MSDNQNPVTLGHRSPAELTDATIEVVSGGLPVFTGTVQVSPDAASGRYFVSIIQRLPHTEGNSQYHAIHHSLPQEAVNLISDHPRQEVARLRLDSTPPTHSTGP